MHHNHKKAEHSGHESKTNRPELSGVECLTHVKVGFGEFGTLCPESFTSIWQKSHLRWVTP